MYLVDYRINEYIKNYLQKNNIDYVMTGKNNLYEEINGHPDIVACNICGDIVLEPHTYEILDIKKAIKGASVLDKKYPHDIAYNVIATDKYLIGKIDFVDENIKSIAKKYNLEMINVNQGYARCSTIQLPDNLFITSDKNIYDTIISKGVRVYYVEIDDIYLSDRYSGFLGGASAYVNGRLIFFGSLSKSTSGEKIKKILLWHKIKYEECADTRLVDYGSMIKLF